MADMTRSYVVGVRDDEDGQNGEDKGSLGDLHGGGQGKKRNCGNQPQQDADFVV